METGNKVVVKRNSLTIAFNSIAHFFLYSLLTITTAFSENEDSLDLQLSVIYAIALLAVLAELYFKASFILVIDKRAQTIRLKEDQYALEEVVFEISDRSFYRYDNYDAYELSLKNQVTGKSRQLYGHSTLRDIRELRSQLERRLTSLCLEQGET